MSEKDSGQSADLLNESERPRPSGNVDLRPEQQQPGERLRMIHDHFRAEVGRLVRLVDAVANDELAVSELSDAVDKLSMRRNYEEFGTFCGMACRNIAMHHRLEDGSVFPSLAANELYAPLIEKLMSEHTVIHDQLVTTDARLAAFIVDNENIAPLRDAIHALQQALFSHLQYEDEQLPEPLGLYGF